MIQNGCEPPCPSRAELRQDNPDALGSLFSLYGHQLRRMIEYRLDARLRARVSASDVLQEAYIDAYKRLPHLQNGGDVPVFIWLRTITAQRLIQVHREHFQAQGRTVSKEVRLLDDGGGIEASSEKLAEVLTDLSPSGVYQRSELIAKVRKALEQLPAIDREILALRHFEELSNREIATVLGIQASAASKRYLRALERLRDVFDVAAPTGVSPQ